MASTVRVSARTYRMLHELAAATGKPLGHEVAEGAYQLQAVANEDMVEAVELVERYRELRLGLADASIAIIAARARTTRILTLEERHFRSVRPLWGKAFDLLPAAGR